MISIWKLEAEDREFAKFMRTLDAKWNKGLGCRNNLQEQFRKYSKKIKTVSEIFNRLLPSQTVLNQSLVHSLWWSWNIFCYPAWPQKMTKEVSQSHLRSICYHLRHLEIIFTFNASEFSWYQCAYLVFKKIVKKTRSTKTKTLQFGQDPCIETCQQQNISCVKYHYLISI